MMAATRSFAQLRSKVSPPGADARLRIATSAAVILFLVYPVQIGGPLRLNTDAVKYLTIADSAAHGQGFVYPGEPPPFPPGYPALLAVLIHFRFATASSFVALNCAMLGIGLLAAYQVGLRGFSFQPWISALLCCFTELSYLYLKHTFTAESETAYFASSMLCLLALTYAEQRRGAWSWRLWALAALAALAAIMLRTVGIALIPVLLWAGVSAPARIAASTRLRGVLRCALAAVAMAIAAWFLSQTVYFREWMRWYDYQSSIRGHWAVLFAFMPGHLSELGEIALNVPKSRAPSPATVAFPVAGAILLVLVLFGMWKRRRNPGAIGVYLPAYAATVAAWYYGDARIWLPVVFLLFAYAALAFGDIHFRRTKQALLCVWCVGFVAAGITACVYTTKITIAGSEFSINSHDDDTIRVLREFGSSSAER